VKTRGILRLDRLVNNPAMVILVLCSGHQSAHGQTDGSKDGTGCNLGKLLKQMHFLH
jgi:hypothetical protein